MQEMLNQITFGINFIDIIDILIVAFILYKALEFIRQTRAEQLLKGLLVLIVATFLSDRLNLHTLNWMLKGATTLGLVALVIVFQPELRRGLESLGRSKLIVPALANMDKGKAKHIIAEFVTAIENFSKDRVGALVVLERQTALSDIAESGTLLNAEISSELLTNIFYLGSPLHDGAVIVRGDRILAAGCVLPLTTNKTIAKELGTRHRAGIGITEHSDSMVLMVSEETGVISTADGGKLSRFLDAKTIEKNLMNFYLSGNTIGDKISLVPAFFRRIRRKKGDKK